MNLFIFFYGALLSMVDLHYTFYNFQLAEKVLPKKPKFDEYEINPFIQAIYKRFGLNKTRLITMSFFPVIVGFFAVFGSLEFTMGAWMVLIIMHLSNLNYLIKIKNEKGFE